MKPQTRAYLVAAEKALSESQTVLQVHLPVQAARLAYHSQLYAAQALIFERLDKVVKTHKGVDQEFHRLTKSDPTFARDLAAQLSKAYNYKAHADYNIDTSNIISSEMATAIISTARQFVDTIRLSIERPPP